MRVSACYQLKQNLGVSRGEDFLTKEENGRRLLGVMYGHGISDGPVRRCKVVCDKVRPCADVDRAEARLPIETQIVFLSLVNNSGPAIFPEISCENRLSAF